MLSRRAACLVLKPPPRIPVRSILTASTSGKPVVVVGVEQVGDEQSFELTPSAHRIVSTAGLKFPLRFLCLVCKLWRGFDLLED